VAPGCQTGAAFPPNRHDGTFGGFEIENESRTDAEVREVRKCRGFEFLVMALTVKPISNFENTKGMVVCDWLSVIFGILETRMSPTQMTIGK